MIRGRNVVQRTYPRLAVSKSHFHGSVIRHPVERQTRGQVEIGDGLRGEILHALRVTITRTRRAYVHPATHYASQSNNPNLPRMGERIRLRREFTDEKQFFASKNLSGRIGWIANHDGLGALRKCAA